MIAEAVDAALLVWRALWVWIVVLAGLGAAGVLGAVAGVWAICRMLRRAWTAMGPRTDSLAPLAAEQPAATRESPGTAERRSGPPLRPTPSWARKEAA